MKILDHIQLHTILVAVVFLGLAPFAPPHSVEKIGMLFAGELTKPIDILDLLFHLSPLLVLALKIKRMKQLSKDE